MEPGASDGGEVFYRRWRMSGPWEANAQLPRFFLEPLVQGTALSWNEPRLWSMWDPAQEWPPGESVHALCRVRRPRGPHEIIPAPKCKCGLYGCSELDATVLHGCRPHGCPPYIQALGAVRLSGNVVATELGARGGRAEVVALL
jgi:hypothetical protein